MRLSVIVPILNEAASLSGLLQNLTAITDVEDELILVDGGSTDGSQELALAAGVIVMAAPRGRALQMNAGAATARGDILVFLHADTLLPLGAGIAIRQCLVNSSYDWGWFDVSIDGSSRWFPVIAKLMNIRSRLTGIATGDHALFVTTPAFVAVGGYPEQALMEDIELSRALKRRSRPACLRTKVVTSGRRWEKHGVIRTMLLMWWLRFRYFLGAAPDDLAKAYR